MLRVNIHLDNCSSFMMYAIENPDPTHIPTDHWLSLVSLIPQKIGKRLLFLICWDLKRGNCLGNILSTSPNWSWVKHKRLICLGEKMKTLTGHLNISRKMPIPCFNEKFIREQQWRLPKSLLNKFQLHTKCIFLRIVGFWADYLRKTRDLLENCLITNRRTWQVEHHNEVTKRRLGWQWNKCLTS